ncbi:MAG: hypothetical protein ACR2IM_06755 [Sediminibacterium sp.]
MAILWLVSIVGAARAQPQQIPKGIFNQLIEIKYSSELYLSTQLKNNKNSEAQKDSAIALYNTLRWQMDGFVYALSGDMIAHNSPRKIRLLDKWCLNHLEPHQKTNNYPSNIAPYILQFKDIQNLYENKIQTTLYQNAKTINLTTNVFYILKDSYTIIKALADIKTQKTMALIELLDHTRLLSLGEVVKMGK